MQPVVTIAQAQAWEIFTTQNTGLKRQHMKGELMPKKQALYASEKTQGLGVSAPESITSRNATPSAFY